MIFHLKQTDEKSADWYENWCFLAQMC
jgi:hypothetical protein